MINKEDLIKGKIYVGRDLANQSLYIWRCLRDGYVSSDFCIYSDNKSSKFFRNIGSHGWNNIEEPTNEERLWLEDCINNNRLVLKHSNQINYEIY